MQSAAPGSISECREWIRGARQVSTPGEPVLRFPFLPCLPFLFIEKSNENPNGVIARARQYLFGQSTFSFLPGDSDGARSRPRVG